MSDPTLLSSSEKIEYVMGRIYPAGREITCFIVEDYHMPFSADETGKNIANMSLYYDQTYATGHPLLTFRLINQFTIKVSEFTIAICPIRMAEDQLYERHIHDLHRATLRAGQYANKPTEFALVGASLYAAIQEGAKDISSKEMVKLIMSTGSGYITLKSPFHSINKMFAECRAVDILKASEKFSLPELCAYCKSLHSPEGGSGPASGVR